MSRDVKAKSPKLSPPVVARPERLPLGDSNFSWEQFEAFCRHFISCLPDVEDCHHYGKRGNRQRGIDLVAVLRDGQHWVFQCKQYKRFTEEQVKKAVSATTFRADRYILLLACEASSEVRDEVRKHPKWRVWDVRDISHNVRHLPSDAARLLIETHFDAAWRNKFLGLQSQGAFVTSEEFFSPLTDSANLFNHSWALVGRTQYKTELHHFVSSEHQLVTVLVGRGGIGKTKILHAFAQEFDRLHPGEGLRFIVEGMPLTIESADVLPHGPCTVVVDDAHRREDLPFLIAIARRRTPRAKLILAVRPGAAERTMSLLTQGGFDAREVVVLNELKELGLDEVKELAGQALGDRDSPHVPALAAATRDSPLITLIGGRLLAEKAVDVRLLERHDEFRRAVLTRFQDVLIGQVAERVKPEFCRALLRLLAGISPFRTGNDGFQQAATEFLGVPSEQVAEALRVLEEAGVLLRRGYTLRITPDVLADHLLHQACLTSNGDSSHYAERLFERFASICPSQVLSNLAELDWRIHRSTGEETNLLDAIWQSIRSEFASASNDGRCYILDVLKEAAYHQPGRALQIVEFAMRNPAPPDSGEAARYYQSTHADVLHKLPAVLKRIGYTLDYLPRCCDLLWELGCDDGRPTGPYPEHAMRVLEDFAGYDIGKPVAVNRAVVEAADRWLSAPDAHDHIHSPFTILNAVLQKSAHSSHNEDHTIVSRAFVVSKENTEPVREEALRLVAGGALSERLAVSLRAIESLKVALQDPVPYFDMVITDEELRRWEPDHLKVLDLFGEIISKTSHSLVHLAVAEAVTWDAHLNRLDSVRLGAQEVLGSVPETHALRLTRALTNGYDFYTGLDDKNFNASYDARLREISEERQRTVSEFLQSHPDAAQGLSHLETLVREIAAAGKQPEPWAFLCQLANTDSAYAASMCIAILEKPDCMLAPHLATLLPFVNRDDAERASDIAKRIVAGKHPVLCRSLAASTGFWGNRWENSVPADDLELVCEMGEFDDPAVKLSVINLLPVLWHSGHKQAAEMACAMNVGDDVGLLFALCGIFRSELRGIPLNALTDEQLRTLLAQLQSAASIDDRNVGKLISYASTRVPRDVVTMLLGRVARSRGEEYYEPLPPLGLKDRLDGLKSSAEYTELLRTVRDRMLQTDDAWHTEMYLPRLYEEVSLHYSQPCLRVLSEWIESGDATKVVGASRLLKEAHPNFVFTEEAFVANLLEKAYAISDECYMSVGSYLTCLAISGERMGIPGQPFPQDITRRDQSRETAARYPAGSPVHKFYDELRKEAESSIKNQLARDEELIG